MAPTAGRAQTPAPVTVELALLVDVSGSIDPTEFALQRGGYIAAFRNFGFWDAFGQAGRSLAVSYTEWAGAAEQAQLGGVGSWYFVNSGATAATFANLIAGLTRPFVGSTEPGSAVNYIRGQFLTNAYAGTRRVIDISSDGCAVNNGSPFPGTTFGHNLADQRFRATQAGITINAITIGNDRFGCDGATGLADWYAKNAVTRGGFLIEALDFADFSLAIGRKIGREIAPDIPFDPAPDSPVDPEQPPVAVPEPGGVALALTGLAVIAVRRARRQRRRSSTT